MREGAYFLCSRAIMVCRVQPARLASSSCVISLWSKRSLRMRLVTLGLVIPVHSPVVGEYPCGLRQCTDDGSRHKHYPKEDDRHQTRLLLDFGCGYHPGYQRKYYRQSSYARSPVNYQSVSFINQSGFTEDHVPDDEVDDKASHP